MTSLDIIKALRVIKGEFKDIIELYVFGSTASYSRKSRSDVDLLMITKLNEKDSLNLSGKIKTRIRKMLGIGSDIVFGESLRDLKITCLNQNIFNNLIKI